MLPPYSHMSKVEHISICTRRGGEGRGGEGRGRGEKGRGAGVVILTRRFHVVHSLALFHSWLSNGLSRVLDALNVVIIRAGNFQENLQLNIQRQVKFEVISSVFGMTASARLKGTVSSQSTWHGIGVLVLDSKIIIIIIIIEITCLSYVQNVQCGRGDCIYIIQNDKLAKVIHWDLCKK